MAASDPVELFNARGPVGLFWSDGTHLSFASVESESTALVDHLTSLVETANTFDADPGTLFSIVFDRARKFDPSLRIDAGLTAAAAPDFDYVEKSPYSLTLDDNDNVLGLVWNDEGEITVREDGEWMTPLEDDARFYNNQFHFVTEDAVNLFDRLVQEGSPLTSDAFKEVYV